MGTTPSEPAASARRLHPFSWLFVLLTQLRLVVAPLVALLFFGGGSTWELWAAAGGGVLAIYSLIYSMSFRYQLCRDEMVVREGIFSRTERHIPYGRIQNVVQKRNPLHRLFAVTELRLESAGGVKPEAVMCVITLAEAARIERVLRGHAPAPAAETAPGDSLFALAHGDLWRLGLVTDRGMVVVGAALALYWQSQPWERASVRAVFGFVRDAVGSWSHAFSAPLALAASALMVLLGFVVLLKVLSVAMAYLSFYGFRLVREGERVATEGGLLTRHAASARVDKIQRLIVAESWLARRLHRRWLFCDVAAGMNAMNAEEGARLKWLVPIGTREHIRAVIDAVAPGLDPDARDWRPLHPKAWRRKWTATALLLTLAAVPASTLLGWTTAGWWAVAMLWSLLRALGWARFAAYAYDGEVVAYRSGWIARQWTVLRVAKCQSAQLRISPFDRRHRMAKLALDSAGAAAVGGELVIPYLDEAEARAMFDKLVGGSLSTAGEVPACQEMGTEVISFP